MFSGPFDMSVPFRGGGPRHDRTGRHARGRRRADVANRNLGGERSRHDDDLLQDYAARYRTVTALRAEIERLSMISITANRTGDVRA